MTNLIKKAKKIIAGAGLVALSTIANVDASENNISPEERARIDQEADRMFDELANRLKTKSEKQNKNSVSYDSDKFIKGRTKKESKLEEQFKKSPFLYQKYNGYIDRYIKVAKTLTPEELAQAEKAIAELDKKYFNTLCEDSSYGTAYNSEFIFDVEIKNGERHLVHNRDSYVLCGPEDSDYVEIFRFSREHCDSDRPVCYAHQFGQDMVCSCHGDHDFDNDIETTTRLLDKKSTSSLNKAKANKVAMIQSMLKVQGR